MGGPERVHGRAGEFERGGECGVCGVFVCGVEVWGRGERGRGRRGKGEGDAGDGEGEGDVG